MKKKRLLDQNGFRLFLLISPFLLFVFIFSYLPLYGWIYVLFDYKPGRAILDCEFVVLANFTKMFTDKYAFDDIVRILRNTFAMSFLGIITAPLPMIFAIFLSEIKCSGYRRLVQTPTTIPNFISWVFVYSIAYAMFSVNDGMEQYFVFQNAMNKDSIEVLDLYVYNQGMVGFNYSFSTAVSILKSLVSVTLLFMANVIPFYYLFINTISGNDLLGKGLILWFPQDIHFSNYGKIMKIRGLLNAAFISLGRIVLGTVLTLIGTSFLGYALTKSELWHRKICYRFVIITMYFNGGIIPWFINMKNLGLTNNFFAYIIPGIITPFSLILFKTYVESIPSSLEESAALDGAGYLVRFTRVIAPLCKPIIATIAIFSAVGQWNSFTDTFFLMTDSELYRLQYLSEASSLVDTLKQMAQSGMPVDTSALLTSTSIKMTVSMVVVIPILCVYPFFQKFFANGIMIGAIKG